MYEDRIQWVTHKGKRIFYTDFSNLKSEQSIQMLAEVDIVIRKEPIGSVLMLGNYENSPFSMNTLTAFNKYTPEHQKYLKANSMVGIKGLTKVMFDGASKFLKTEFRIFNTKEEALDWLATK